MNKKSRFSIEDLYNGKLIEGVHYNFRDGEDDQIVIAIQKLPKGYWIKTQTEEAIFDFEGRITERLL